MSLRIRRGTDAQRQQITPDDGELIYTTNTKKLYLGDGVTQGGNNIGQSLAGTGLVFDTITQTLQATGGGGGGGILSVSADLNPSLGGNLNLSNHNITGTGNIGTVGTIYASQGLGGNLNLNGNSIVGTGNTVLLTSTGILSAAGLGTDLSLNGKNIVGIGNIATTGTLAVTSLGSNLALGGWNINGTGNIATTGNLNVSGTIIAQTGLGAALSLNGFNISGTGNIAITGTLGVTGLGANLALNSYNITGTGNINTTGNLAVTGTVTAAGLGANLALNSFNITGTGNINTTGTLTVTGAIAGAAISGTTITATTGLGASLALNSYSINGTGSIGINGAISGTTITATSGLGANLPLNSFNINGTGSIIIDTGNVTVTTGNISTGGTITATTGLGANLSLNSNNITGSGNISISGNATFTPNTILDVPLLISGVGNSSTTNSIVGVQTSRTGTTTLLSGDYIGTLQASGYNGTTYKKAMVITSTMAGSVQGNGSFNADTTLNTLNADGNFRQFIFKSTGLFAFTGGILTAINTAARDASTATTGTFIYNSDTLSLQVYTGSAWSTLPTVVSVPATATSTGKTGQIAFDNTYFYVCTGTNVWRRTALSTW